MGPTIPALDGPFALDEPTSDVMGRVLSGPGAVGGPMDAQALDAFQADVDLVDDLLEDDTLPMPPALERPDDDIVYDFEARLIEASEFREPFEARWLKAWRDYNQRLSGDEARWNSKLFMPYLYALVSTAIPAAVAAAFDAGTISQVGPQRPDDERRAATVEALLDWYMKVKIPARRVLRDFLWYAYLYGTSAVRVRWRFERKQKLVPTPTYRPGPIDPDTGEEMRGEFVGVRRALKTVTVHDEPELTCVDLWNIFLCPWTRHGETQPPYVIEYVESTRAEVEAAARAGYFGVDGEDRWAEYFSGDPAELNNADGSIYSRLGSRAAAFEEVGFASPYGRGSNAPNRDTGIAPVAYYMMTTADYVVFVSADGSRKLLGKKISDEPYEGLPYVFFNYDRIPGWPYGKGIGEIAGPIQSNINFDVNHANDSRRIRMNAPMLARRFGNSLVEGDTEMRPNKIIRVMDPTDITPLVIPDTTQSMLEWQGMLVQFGDKATGVNDLARGFAQPGASTATEASLIDAQTAMRRVEHGNEWASAMKELLRRVLALIQTYTTEEVAIRIAGQSAFEWQTITPEDILGEFDVVPSVSFLKSNPALVRQDWLALLPNMLGHPLVKQQELLRRTLKVFDVEHPETLIMEPPPPPTDPEIEEIALRFGIDVDPSPEEDFVAHLQAHAMHLQALMAEPVKDPRAINAHQRHIQKTLQAQAELAMAVTAGAEGAVGGSPAKPGGGGSDVRRGATRLGQAQGSDGPPGRSPGPAQPPGRPARSAR